MKVERRTNIRRRGGFTLVELLVVLAILVLLISMVGPRILGSKQKADVSAAKTQIGMLQSALEAYVVDMRQYPETEVGLAALIEDPTKDDEKKSKWDGPYLKKGSVPKDPWGNDYQYAFPGTHGNKKEPDLWSSGPDGQENSEDDIVSWDTDKKEKE